jgi:hypothetical protein
MVHEMRVSLPLLLLVAAACGEGSGAVQPPAFAGGCQILSAEPIHPDAAPLGFTAEQAAARAPARHDLELLYGTDRSIDPAVRLEVELEAFDPDRVFFVRTSIERMGDVDVPCPQAITFPAVIRFRSADGAFDESLEVDLLATEAALHEWVAHVPLPQLHGSFTPAEERGWSHRGVNIGGRFDHGGAVGGISLTSSGSGSTRIATIGFWGEDPPAF